MSAKVLVVGGAGYVGSHMVSMLIDEGYDVVTVDNLSTGYRDSVLGGLFVHGDLCDTVFLDKLFGENRFDVVMHFASSIVVPESVQDPGKYYRNNVSNTIHLLNAMQRHGALRIVFSSSAAVYGLPTAAQIPEDHPTIPVNPYGRTKLMVEQILEDYEQAHGIRSIRFRYFNAAGAHAEARIGERHVPETHLIPLVLRAAAPGDDVVVINGVDYPTEDGTCVRDFVHVTDICAAHMLGMRRLLQGGKSDTFNLGNGQGFSVRQVVDAVERVTKCKARVVTGPRRAGDPPSLVADSRRVRAELGWQPRYAELDTIIRHAWQWERNSRQL